MTFSIHFLNLPVVYKLGTRWTGYLPVALSYGISQGVADLTYFLYKDAVVNMKRNLSLALPDLSEKDLQTLVRRIFRNYSRYLVDYARFTNLKGKDVVDRIVCFEGKENLEAALEMKKGLILLTGHLGNWELGGIFFGSYGIKTNVVTIQDRNPEIDAVRRWYRERHNVDTITIGTDPFSTIKLVNSLNNGEIVAMLIDRYEQGLDSMEVDFFGRQCPFPRGPFVLSRLTGAPIIVAFVVSEENGYKGVVEKPLIVRGEDEERVVLEKVVGILERYIMLYPDQWYNFPPIGLDGVKRKKQGTRS